jgi:hypothetical protein
MPVQNFRAKGVHQVFFISEVPWSLPLRGLESGRAGSDHVANPSAFPQLVASLIVVM